MHFTPTGASWLNRVERFFCGIPGNRLRRDRFKDVDELELAVARYIEHYNNTPLSPVMLLPELRRHSVAFALVLTAGCAVSPI